MTKSKLKAILKQRGYQVPRKFTGTAYRNGSRFEFVLVGDTYEVYSYNNKGMLLYGPRTLEAMIVIELQNKIAELGFKWQKKQVSKDK